MASYNKVALSMGSKYRRDLHVLQLHNIESICTWTKGNKNFDEHLYTISSHTIMKLDSS